MCQNILIIRAVVIGTHHGERKWPGWRGRIQTTLETMWKIRAEEEKEGFGNSSYKGRGVCFPPAVLLTVMTQSPGRPLSRTRRHTSNLPWHRAAETKGEPRKASLHGFTLVCQNTGLFREYTSPGGSRFKRKNERTDDRPGKGKLKTGALPILNFGLFLPLFT